MGSHRLDYEIHREALRRETETLLASTDGDLELPVPSCPEWRLEDLIVHLGEVYRFFRTQLEAASPEAPSQVAGGGAPGRGELLGWFEEEGAGLRDALAERDPAEPCWNWSGAELNAGWVARRMALETAVHRYDAELTVDAPTPIERELAIDGIEEWITVHLATDVPEAADDANLSGVLCLACSDDTAAWTVEVAGGRLRWREGRGPADAVLVGPASGLYLYCWNRAPLESLALTGRAEVARAWTSLVI